MGINFSFWGGGGDILRKSGRFNSDFYSFCGRKYSGTRQSRLRRHGSDTSTH